MHGMAHVMPCMHDRLEHVFALLQGQGYTLLRGQVS